MTQGFDEWVRNNFFAPYDTPDCEQSYEAGQQSRQAEIDELQKRIDEALVKIQDDCREYGISDSLELAVHILRGGEDE